MLRFFPMTILLSAALVCTACNSSSVGNSAEAEAEASPLDKPMAPGASFTDVPPVPPPVTESAQPAPSP